MNKFFKCFLVWLTAAAASFGAAAGPAAVSSPDGRIAVTVSTDKAGRLSYSVSRDSHVVLAPSTRPGVPSGAKSPKSATTATSSA